MKTTVKKLGNSAAVRIPPSVMRAMRLTLDDVVDVREERGRILIEPIGEKVCDLGELLRGITPENRHEAIDFGPPAGQEVW